MNALVVVRMAPNRGGGPPGLSRRALVRAAAAMALAGASAAACGPLRLPGARGGSAVPTPATGGTPVSFVAMYQAGLWNGNQSKVVLEAIWQAMQPFRDSHPSLRLTMEPLRPGIATTDFVAGAAPDLVVGWPEFTSLANAGYLLDLTPYIRQDNRQLDVWPIFAVGGYRVDQGLFALPFYVSTTSMVQNLALLDDLGLDYPEPGWTWSQWVQLWESTTRRAQGGTGTRAGGGVFWYSVGLVPPYFRGWGGAIMDPNAPTDCLLGDQACSDCGNAVFPLISEGVLAVNDTGNGVPNLLAGTQGTCCLWDAALASATVTEGLVRLPKWDFFRLPVMPRGSFAWTASVFRAISASAKAPDACWELLSWLCWDPTVQRVLMHYGLEPPALKSLQPEYATVLQQLVPRFAGKNMDAIIGPIQDDTVVPNIFFPVDEQQAAAVLLDGQRDIVAGRVDVALGLRTMADQVTAMERAGLSELQRRTTPQRAFPVQGAAMAQVPPGL